MSLLRPTPEVVKTYLDRFEKDGYGITDNAIFKLFTTFPCNDRIEEVLLKVAAVNNLYNTNIYAVYDVAWHIHGLNVDTDLAEGSLALVDKIARITIKGKSRRNYSFATKYCSFHVPAAYPIYDSYVDALLWRYQKIDEFERFKRWDLQEYARYKEIVEKFRVYYGLTQYTLKQMDRFLWLYGLEVFPRQ